MPSSSLWFRHGTIPVDTDAKDAFNLSVLVLPGRGAGEEVEAVGEVANRWIKLFLRRRMLV